MNDFLRYALSFCLLCLLFAGNVWLVHRIFDLDISYLLDAMLSVLWSLSLTIIELIVFRLITGKLKIRLIWQ